jgi:hypothetical protein
MVSNEAPSWTDSFPSFTSFRSGNFSVIQTGLGFALLGLKSMRLDLATLLPWLPTLDVPLTTRAASPCPLGPQIHDAVMRDLIR